MLSHSLNDSNGAMDWDRVIAQASLGRDPDCAPYAKTLTVFVQAWSDGEDGRVLVELESYERALQVRKTIWAEDLFFVANWMCHAFTCTLQRW